MSFKRLAGPTLLAIVLSVAACSQGPDSLAPDQRYITSELPASARVGFRHLPVHGAPNFRDLGGYTTSDGRVVKWGKLYRTDALNELTDGDQGYLERLDIQRIVDFRIPDEAGDAPDKLPAELRARYINMPVGFNDGNYAEFVKKIMSGDTQGLNLEGALEQGNVKFVREFTPVFRDWLHGLVTTADGSQIFHCTAGKDRTGVAIALLLDAVGAERAAVVADYAASEANLSGAWADGMFAMIDAMGVPRTPTLDELIAATPPAAIEEALAWLDREHGGSAAYLRSGGLTEAELAALRRRLTE